jgi:NAD(P)-dependent dehydrogenase (short-subunit alcohol dehydrogenase family)
MATTKTAFAIIAGVGLGTGASLARKFALSYPVALLARNPDNFTSLVDEINKSGGKAIGIKTDVASASSVTSAVQEIKESFGDKCAAAVFNASGPFARKSILELTEKEFTGGYEVSCKGAFLFSQQVLPMLVAHSEDSSAKYPGSLIFTGATASVKSNALMSAFSTGKYAMRALSQSIAREFAPKGVHVAHAIIDGVIDIPRTKEWLKDMPAEGKIEADAIAEAYWNLHTQSRRAFTNEIDIRPMLEKW